MNKEAYWWVYTPEYVYGNRENVPTKKSLLNFFKENEVIEQKIRQLEEENLYVIGVCIFETISSLKIGFYVKKKQ